MRFGKLYLIIKRLTSILILPAGMSILYSCNTTTGDWTNLLDKSLTHWDKYLSYRHKDNYDGKVPVDNAGMEIEPVGYNKDEANVFSVEISDGEPVLHITGEIYGCIFTKDSFSNYHLILKYKWGKKKWEPRTDKLMDSGILYNSTGECGVDYWRSWMLGQEFQVMEGHSGDYWSIKNSAIDVRAFLPEGTIMNAVADAGQPFLPIGTGTDRMGFCLRSANYESPKGEWTTLELICFGDKSIHIVNGKVVMVLKNSRYVTDKGNVPLTSGKIQIQSEAGEVFYKEMKIKKLNSIPEKYAGLFND